MLRMRVEFRKPWVRLTPFWTALGGILTAGSILLEPAGWLRALLALLLAEGVMTGWRDNLLALAGWKPNRPPEPADPPPYLPYALPGSPAWKGAQAFGRFRALWESAFWPERGEQLLALGFFTGVGALLGVLLGREALLILMAAVAVAAVEALARRKGRECVIARGIFLAGMPWLLGRASAKGIEPFTLLASVFVGTLAWGLWEPSHPKGRIVAGISAAALALLLWGIARPVAAAAVLLLALALVPLEAARSPRRMEPLAVLMVLVTALALP